MPRITECWVFIAEDSGPDDEGIPAITTPDGRVMPLVCADRARVESFRPIAKSLAQGMGKRIRLVRFHQLEETGEVYEP